MLLHRRAIADKKGNIQPVRAPYFRPDTPGGGVSGKLRKPDKAALPGAAKPSSSEPGKLSELETRIWTQAIRASTQQDNGLPYARLAVVYAALGAFLFVAPNTAANVMFTAGIEPQDFLPELFFHLIAILFELVALYNFVQMEAADEGRLGETIHIRANAALSTFAATCWALLLVSYGLVPILQPTAAAFLAVLAGAQILVSKGDYVRYSREGLNFFASLASYAKDLTKITRIDGVSSGLYSLFTAAFIGIGFLHLGAPNPSAAGMFHFEGKLRAEDRFLWEFLGSTIASIVGTIAFTQQEAALQNDISVRPNRLLMTGLAVSSAAYVVTLAPLLFTDKSGSLLLWGGIPWGSLAIVSTLLALKPQGAKGSQGVKGRYMP